MIFTFCFGWWECSGYQMCSMTLIVFAWDILLWLKKISTWKRVRWSPKGNFTNNFCNIYKRFSINDRKLFLFVLILLWPAFLQFLKNESKTIICRIYCSLFRLQCWDEWTKSFQFWQFFLIREDWQNDLLKRN